ncbi:MAG: ATP-dependent RNA helicase HrpA [Desulfobacterales bacterium]|nr:ATP-dependent RNA helicase HrpA [Desulfobacterales bacterium]
MIADRMAAVREIERLTRKKAKPLPADKLRMRLERLEKRLNASGRNRARRQKNLPQFSYNADLPITAKKTEIIRAIERHPVVIVSGETGSGKTTQLPKFCLEAGRGIDGIIGHTQPRRIAAMTVARRIAEEFGQEIGRAVGYKIRFKDRTAKNAYLKIMTDGILLAETQTDRFLNAYDTIIVDEAHERNLNIDFILGILQTLLARRDDLKLVITSATIDTEKFSKTFGDAPVIEVSGRMYPVDVRYQPPEFSKEENNDLTHVELAAQAVSRLLKESARGDILVFMPTEQDIRDTCELIEAARPKKSRILPLYARLTASEQARVFARLSERKIIVATNVAETSLTIPGIKYVVDSGLARILRYSPRSRTTSLPVVPVSRSSADQRKGRCGRVQNGICVRLFTEDDYLSRPLYTRPEILRANLAEVILRMIALRLGDIVDFPFIDRPDSKSINDGFDLLYELGAIKARHKAHGARRRARKDSAMIKSNKTVELTKKGRLMAKIPLDPRLSRMLLEARDRRCIDQIAVIAAALSIRDSRERPLEKTAEADRMHAQFDDPSSDFTTLLNIWNRYTHVWQTQKRANQLKRFCRQHFLSFNRMREWRDIYHQIGAILEEFGIGDRRRAVKVQPQNLNLDREDPLYQSIHKSILSGYLSNIAEKKEKNFFRATQNREVMVFPGSGLFDRAGQWMVAAEMVETSRLFARTVANIESQWLEELAGDLCKRNYLNPRWKRNRGKVMADEQVSLFGLIIISQRSVPYGPINPDEASDIFIRAAIIKGDLKKPFAFMTHNQRLIDDIEGIENRLRRRDVLISEEDLFAFYREKLPGIYSVQMLSNKIKKRGGDRFLCFKKPNLMNYDPDAGELARYPLSTKIDGQMFQYRYHFGPGQEDDGVTIQVPVSMAPAVSREAFDWLVPGMFKEKIETLIKGLPKVYRKKLVPVNETVEIISREIPRKKNALFSALGEFILQRFGVDIPASAWPIETLPDHLKMRISVIAPDGKELCSSRETAVLLQQKIKATHTDEFESFRLKWEKSGITRWDFGDLPEFISSPETVQNKWVAYPALVAADDRIKSVSLKLFRHPDKALAIHQQGVAGLYKIHFAKDLKILKKGLKLPKALRAAADFFKGPVNMEQRLLDRIISDLFCRNIRSADSFYRHAEDVSPILISRGQGLLDRCLPVLKAYHNARKEFDKLKRANLNNHAVQNFCKDLITDLVRLVPESFVNLYEMDRLTHLIRYIKCMEIRAQRALVDFEKDQAKAKDIKTFSDRLDKMIKTLSPNASNDKREALEDFFWMIEEYKVSIFAQELKTAFPVSEKRLEKKLAQIKRMI